MFEYQKTSLGRFVKHSFMDQTTKTGFVLVPERGALVLEIWFNGHQILDTYSTAEELEELKWSKTAILFPFPNRLRDGKFEWLNKEYTWPKNNPATHNAIHGMVNKVQFRIVEVKLTEAKAEVRCRYDYDGSNPSYPFAYTLDMIYCMDMKRRFWVGFDLLNKCEHQIPAGFGWHPYFKIGDANANDHHMTLAPAHQILIDERMIPTGGTSLLQTFLSTQKVDKTSMDTCFLIRNKNKTYKLSLQNTKNKLTLVSSGTRFPYYQVFTPPHRNSIALEPMTCNIDALNNQEGIKIIEAGSHWKERFYLEYK
jgi:aldose 1-epimerase